MSRFVGRFGGGVAAGLLAVVTIAPIILVVIRSVATPAGVTWRHYQEAFSDPANLQAIGNTLVVSAATVLFAAALAIPAAWLVARTDLPGARRFRALLLVPYVVPPYLGAIAWINLANPTVGWLNRAAGGTVFDIYTTTGIVWVLGLFYYTFMYLTSLSALENMDASLEDAARVSGAGPFTVLRTITLPLIRPAILAGAFLVFAASASAFGVPALVGTPARVHVLTTRIYSHVTTGGLDGLYTAAALSVPLLVIALLTWMLADRLGRGGRITSVTGKASAPSRVALGAWRWPICAAVASLVFLTCLLPVFAIVLTSLMNVVGDFRWSNVTIDKYRYVLLTRPDTARGFINSFALAFAAATLAVAIGTGVAYVQGHPHLKARRALDLCVNLPYAAPGTILALGLILLWSWPLALIDTLWVLLLAYVAKHLSLAVRSITTAVRQTDVTLEEAARISGAGVMMTFRTIWIPLLRPAILAGFFLVFMPAFGELTMSILLVGPGTETVGTVLFALQEYADPPSASVVAVLILAFILAAYAAAAALAR
ncbi:MAG TPA: iron ABC transporter permease [Vicinamibacterales bacterium]